jgi:hypothetical protein
MLELIWGSLNIGIFIYFLYICLKSAKNLHEKLGGFASLIFIFGLLAYMPNPNDENTNNKTFNSSNEIEKFSGDSYIIEKKLLESITSEIKLIIKLGENKNGEKLLTAQTSRNGFISGINWNVKNIIVEKSPTENKYFYNVYGLFEWNLLGLKLYSESKNFKGELNSKK